MAIRVGYVPEHFSTPLQFAQSNGYFQEAGVTVEMISYPSGSGAMIQSLNSGDLDIAIGLTEAFVRGIADTEESSEPKYQIVGTYVTSPLNWAVSTGIKRDDLQNLTQLEGGKIGVSRIGSGSYVMSFVMALQLQFKSAFKFSVCNTFENLRRSVNSGETDAFMWEYFTSKRYYDTKEIKMIGSIETPWPSWVVVKAKELPANELLGFVKAVNRGIEYFNGHHEEAVDYIGTHLDYSHEDAAEWLRTVKFHDDCGKVNNVPAVITATVNILKTAGVLKHNDNDKLLERNMQLGLYQTQ